jgi:hypothetical protein
METCSPVSQVKHNRKITATYGHEDTAYTYIGTKSFAYPRAFPEDAHESRIVLASSHISGVVAFRTRSYFGP